jgi:hypothetical protein
MLQLLPMLAMPKLAHLQSELSGALEQLIALMISCPENLASSALLQVRSHLRPPSFPSGCGSRENAESISDTTGFSGRSSSQVQRTCATTLRLLFRIYEGTSSRDRCNLIDTHTHPNTNTNSTTHSLSLSLTLSSSLSLCFAHTHLLYSITLTPTLTLTLTLTLKLALTLTHHSLRLQVAPVSISRPNLRCQAEEYECTIDMSSRDRCDLMRAASCRLIAVMLAAYPSLCNASLRSDAIWKGVCSHVASGEHLSPPHMYSLSQREAISRPVLIICQDLPVKIATYRPER